MWFSIISATMVVISGSWSVPAGAYGLGSVPGSRESDRGRLEAEAPPRGKPDSGCSCQRPSQQSPTRQITVLGHVQHTPDLAGCEPVRCRAPSGENDVPVVKTYFYTSASSTELRARARSPDVHRLPVLRPGPSPRCGGPIVMSATGTCCRCRRGGRCEGH